MEMGEYKKKIDFGKYIVSRFAPHLFKGQSGGCGANALSLITGISPLKIKNSNKINPEDWKDSFMVSFLRHRGCNVIPLTKCNISNKDSYLEYLSYNHIILTSQLMSKNMASWQVIFDSYVFHNFTISSFSGLEFLNHPIISAYLVFHPNWK